MELNKISDGFQKEINQLAIERCLQLSAQAMADIGSHIIVQNGWSPPNTYSNIIKLLGEKKIINKKLSSKLESFMGLRNILVHSYLEINNQIINDNIIENINDFKQFVNELNKYLEKN